MAQNSPIAQIVLKAWKTWSMNKPHPSFNYRLVFIGENLRKSDNPTLHMKKLWFLNLPLQQSSYFYQQMENPTKINSFGYEINDYLSTLIILIIIIYFRFRLVRSFLFILLFLGFIFLLRLMHTKKKKNYKKENR